MKLSPRTQETLREAIRSVQQMAELTTPRRNGNGAAPPLAIGVTSPNRHEGKTTVAMALASSLADDLRVDVALVDADFRTHSLEVEYGLYGETGFAEALERSSTMESVGHRLPDSTLNIVAAGLNVGDAERHVRTEYAATLLEEMKAQHRFVILDLPATLPSTTAPVMSRLCDGVIIVVRAGRTSQAELRETIEQLRGADIRGVVLNGWGTSIPRWLERLLALGR